MGERLILVFVDECGARLNYYASRTSKTLLAWMEWRIVSIIDQLPSFRQLKPRLILDIWAPCMVKSSGGRDGVAAHQVSAMGYQPTVPATGMGREPSATLGLRWPRLLLEAAV